MNEPLVSSLSVRGKESGEGLSQSKTNIQSCRRVSAPYSAEEAAELQKDTAVRYCFCGFCRFCFLRCLVGRIMQYSDRLRLS